MRSHCLTRSISSAPIASMSLAAASYSPTMASADSLPISVAPSRCWTYSGIASLGGTRAVFGERTAGRSSRTDAVFTTCALISPSRSIPLVKSDAVDSSITDTPLDFNTIERWPRPATVCRGMARDLSANRLTRQECRQPYRCERTFPPFHQKRWSEGASADQGKGRAVTGFVPGAASTQVSHNGLILAKIPPVMPLTVVEGDPRHLNREQPNECDSIRKNFPY